MQRIIFSYMKFNLNFKTPSSLHTCLTKWDVTLDTIKKGATTEYFKQHPTDSNTNLLDICINFSNATQIGDSIMRFEVTKTSSGSQIPGDGESFSLKKRADDLFFMGETLFKNGKLAESVEKYTKAKELYIHMSPPDYVNMGRSAKNMGHAQFQLKNFDNALMSFEEALKMKHKQAWVIENLILNKKNEQFELELAAKVSFTNL